MHRPDKSRAFLCLRCHAAAKNLIAYICHSRLSGRHANLSLVKANDSRSIGKDRDLCRGGVAAVSDLHIRVIVSLVIVALYHIHIAQTNLIREQLFTMTDNKFVSHRVFFYDVKWL